MIASHSALSYGKAYDQQIFGSVTDDGQHPQHESPAYIYRTITYYACILYTCNI